MWNRGMDGTARPLRRPFVWRAWPTPGKHEDTWYVSTHADQYGTYPDVELDTWRDAIEYANALNEEES